MCLYFYIFSLGSHFRSILMACSCLCVQELILAVFRNKYVILGVEPRQVMCMASALPTVLPISEAHYAPFP